MHVALDGNVRARLVAIACAVLVLVALSAYLAAAQHTGAPPSGDFVPRRIADRHLRGPDAEQRRRELLRRTEFRLTRDDEVRLGLQSQPTQTGASPLECRFLNDVPTGTTAKFNCVIDGGTVIKVKYGRNPEIQGEVAGTGLLRLLGFPADDDVVVPSLRCYGCPRDPFVTVFARNWVATHLLLRPPGLDRGYSDFEWVAVERRFPAPAIETKASKGWAWWEMRGHDVAHADDLDALRLLAIFLAHWDNKADNQRLVCLDPDPSADSCDRPLAMIQDLGATFGPTKVNIGRWATLPIWDDRATCRVTMRALPWGGGTFPDARISEAGRRQIADGLRELRDDQILTLFRAARFAEFQTATSDDHDLREWLTAFRARARQIDEAGPCPI